MLQYIVLTIVLANSSISVFVTQTAGRYVSISGDGSTLGALESVGGYEVLHLYNFNGSAIHGMGYLNQQDDNNVELIKIPKGDTLAPHYLYQSDYFMFPQVNKPTISQDGTQIYYLKQNPRINEQTNQTIFLDKANFMGVYFNRKQTQIIVTKAYVILQHMKTYVCNSLDQILTQFQLSNYSVRYVKLATKELYVVIIGYQQMSIVYFKLQNSNVWSQYNIQYNTQRMMGYGLYRDFSNRQLILHQHYLAQSLLFSSTTIVYPKYNEQYGRVYLHACYFNYNYGNSVYSDIFIDQLQYKIQYSSLKLYSSKNHKYIGILFQQELDTSLFMLYQVKKIIRTSKNKNIIPDLKILQHGRIISMDINEDGDIISYIKIDNNNNSQLKVHKHQLGVPEQIYPCDSLSLIYRYSNHCQVHRYLLAGFGLSLAQIICICIVVGCCVAAWNKTKTKRQSQIQQQIGMNILNQLNDKNRQNLSDLTYGYEQHQHSLDLQSIKFKSIPNRKFKQIKNKLNVVDIQKVQTKQKQQPKKQQNKFQNKPKLIVFSEDQQDQFS